MAMEYWRRTSRSERQRSAIWHPNMGTGELAVACVGRGNARQLADADPTPTVGECISMGARPRLTGGDRRDQGAIPCQIHPGYLPLGYLRVQRGEHGERGERGCVSPRLLQLLLIHDHAGSQRPDALGTKPLGR